MCKKFNIVLYIVTAISALVLLIGLKNASFASLDIISWDVREYAGPIKITVNGEERGDYYIPVILSGLEGFDHVRYEITVPESVKDSDTFVIRKGFAKFNIYLEDKLLFSYYSNGKEEGRPDFGFGTYYYIPLGENSQGKRIIIESVEAPIADGYTLGYVAFGDDASVKIRNIIEEIVPLVIAYLLLFMAIIGWAAGLFSREKESSRSLYSTAFLLLVVHMWIFSQSRARQYLVHNPVIPSVMASFAIYFFPLAIYLYFYYNYPIKGSRKCTLLNLFSFSFIIAYYVIGILFLFGLFSYEEALPYTSYAIAIFVVSFVSYVIYLYSKKEKVGSFIIIVLAMGASAILEFIFISFGVHMSNTLMLNVMAFATIAMLIRSLMVFVTESKERQRKEAISLLAYRDPLTGLGNRHEFELFISKAWLKSRYVDVYFFDVNRLKEFNDSLGHDKGDELLKDVASAISSAFPLLSQHSFRLGGDEFVSIVPTLNSTDPERPIMKMHQMLRDKYPFDVFAVGHVRINSRRVSIKDAVALADAKMYEDKENIRKGVF